MPLDLPTGISVLDPRPRAAESPYTFELAHEMHVAAVELGDLVKAMIADVDGGYEAERMWVIVEEIEADCFTGRLDSSPSDMRNLEHGDRLSIPKTHVISVYTGDGRKLPAIPSTDAYWQRCMVDDCVINGRSHVDYFYREEPDIGQGDDQYPDSGWRIRGTPEAIASDQGSKLPPQYVALGVVLNQDDRWLHLIDREPGVAFQWDPASDNYVELD